MDLNVNIDNTLLKLTLESGLELNLQIPRPIQLSIAYGQYWGGIGGDIHNQADLIALIQNSHDHTIEDKEELGKLLLTTNLNNPDVSTHKQYLIAREEYTKPDAPTMTAGGDYDGSKTITITRTTDGSTIYYTTDGSTPTTSSSSFTGASKDVTLSQNIGQVYKTYTVKARAYKNGKWSDVTTEASYNIYRKLSAPTISVGGNKYSSERVVTITSAESGTIMYRYGTSGSYTAYDSSDKPKLNSTNGTTIQAYVTKTDWKQSGNSSKTETVNAKKCYIGQAASISNSDTSVQGLGHSYEQDTLVGSTKTINLGSTAQYVWFAIPSGTAPSSLTVKSDGFAVPLLSASPSDKGSYKVWRTENQIKETFNFAFS